MPLYGHHFGLTSNDELRSGHTQTNREDGKFDTKYVQYHKGYEVEGTNMNVSGQYGVVLRASGFIMKELNVNVTNPISESDALSRALSHISAASYAWQDLEQEASLREAFEDSTKTNYPKGKLVITKKANEEYAYTASNFKLCWQFFIKATDPAGAYNLYIDALTGDVFDDRTPYYEAFYVDGDVWTWYNGLRNIETNTCTFFCNYKLMSGPSRKIYGFSGGTIKTDGDNHWHESDTKTPGTGHWIMDRSLEYYLNRHGRWGSNYQGKPAVVRYEYPFDPSTGTSAGYFYAEDDEDEIGVRPDYNNPAAALDVLAHEYTHAIIKASSNLGILADFDASTLREGFADIFGLLIERRVKGSTDWSFGVDMNVYTRYFTNPNNDWPSPSASTYAGTNWVTSGQSGWYRNSGVLRKWFHLISEGGTHNSITVTGLGIEKANDISYITMNWWLWANVYYHDAASQSVHATIFHYGWCSQEHKSVVRAWGAVGISVPFSLRPLCAIEIEGPAVLVTGKPFGAKTIRPIIDGGIEAGGTYEWTIPENFITEADGNNIVITGVTSLNSGEFVVTYTSPDGSSVSASKVIHVVDGATLPEPQERKLSESADHTTKVKIYPNPANDHLHVNPPEYLENGTFELYDIEGTKVLATTVTGDFVSVTLPDNLSSGMYILHVKSTNFSSVEKIQIIK